MDKSYDIYCTPIDGDEEKLIFHIRAEHEEQALAFLESSENCHKYDEVIKIQCLETKEIYKVL